MLHLLIQGMNRDRIGTHVQDFAKICPLSMLNEKPFDGQLRGLTPLHLVCSGMDKAEQIRPEVLDVLLARKADIEAVDDVDGRTHFLLAGGSGFKAAAFRLAAWKCNVKAETSDGRNFVDITSKCNRSLMQWAQQHHQLEATGNAADPGNRGQREGVSEARFQRQSEWHGWRKRQWEW